MNEDQQFERVILAMVIMARMGIGQGQIQNADTHLVNAEQFLAEKLGIDLGSYPQAQRLFEEARDYLQSKTDAN